MLVAASCCRWCVDLAVPTTSSKDGMGNLVTAMFGQTPQSHGWEEDTSLIIHPLTTGWLVRLWSDFYEQNISYYLFIRSRLSWGHQKILEFVQQESHLMVHVRENKWYGACDTPRPSKWTPQEAVSLFITSSTVHHITFVAYVNIHHYPSSWLRPIFTCTLLYITSFSGISHCFSQYISDHFCWWNRHNCWSPVLLTYIYIPISTGDISSLFGHAGNGIPNLETYRDTPGFHPMPKKDT